jgi:hypothetical protein
MAKRRVTVDSDEDQLENSQASKRARTEEDSDDEPQVIEPKREKKHATKGKGKARPKGDDESDESDEEEQVAEQDADEDKKFEEENEEAIRAAIEAKRKVQGVRNLHFIRLHVYSPSEPTRALLNMALLST